MNSFALRGSKNATCIAFSVLLLVTGGCCCGISDSGYSGSWTPTPSAHIVNVTDADFNSVVLGSEKPMLVDFWAPWCGPCRMVDPAVVTVAEDLHEEINVGRLNVDDNPRVANEYQVWSIPTLALFANGELVAQQIGVPDGASVEQGLRDWVTSELARLSKEANN